MTQISLTAWQAFLTEHAAGGAFTGRVAKVLPFGAFVEVGDGIHGFLPGTTWSEPPETGTDIEVRIDALDVERRRMSLLPA